ncbi:hypothetical protein CEXT_686071 [Caerostris extrusa]|uniref:Uncharacterized protein n=1 Tax=Caerostris extrusa TaxID=172846 RepID=A0AAV4QXS5_CAEEX|nr:hypothetical protein CEXT_686071 [Caerostris extrusa]
MVVWFGSDSLKSLDLNLGEYSLFEKGIENAGFPFRFDIPDLFPAFGKIFVKDEDLYSQALVEEWKIINSLHLDLPFKQELKMRNLSQVEGYWPYIKSFCIYPSNVVFLFYKNLFIDMVTSAIGQTDQIVNVTRKMFKPLQFILEPFKRNIGSQYYQYHVTESLLPIIYKQSLDSNVIKDFLCMFDFEWFITMNQNPEMEEYIFHCANEDNIYLLRKMSNIHRWVAQSIISLHIERLNLFLKYNNMLEFQVRYYQRIMATLVTVMVYPLNTLTIQITAGQSMLTQEAQNILKLIWNSIPDPYLCFEELDDAYESLKKFCREHLFTKNIPEILEFYHETVSKVENTRNQDLYSTYAECRLEKG